MLKDDGSTFVDELVLRFFTSGKTDTFSETIKFDDTIVFTGDAAKKICSVD